MPHEQAAQMMVHDRGTHFDPDVVDAFVELRGARGGRAAP